MSTPGVYKSRAITFLRWDMIYVGPQYETCFSVIPPWRLEFWDGSQASGKSVDPSRTSHVHKISAWRQLFDHIMYLSTGKECSRMSVHFGLFVRSWLLVFCPDQTKCVLLRVLVTKFVQNFPLTFRHRESCVEDRHLFHCSPKNAFYIFN